MMSQYLIRRIFKYLSPLFSLFEKRIVNKYCSSKPSFPVVFILGPPRSGSTILYQMITSFLDVSYINNLIDLARHNLNVGFYLNEKLFPNSAHTSFQSEFGKTEKDGYSAPNEGMFWYKWLPKDRHFLTRDDVREKDKAIIRRKIYAVLNKHNKPLIIKNLAFSMRLDLLAELFPDAKYIYIKRNPKETSMSILNARKKNNTKANKLWSIKPKNFHELEQLKEDEMVVKQVFNIEKQIKIDSSHIGKKSFKQINYEELCMDPLKVIEELRDFIDPNLKWIKDKNLMAGVVRYSETNISPEVSALVNNLDWDDYNE